jgi:hypothetical protein
VVDILTDIQQKSKDILYIYTINLLTVFVPLIQYSPDSPSLEGSSFLFF